MTVRRSRLRHARHPRHANLGAYLAVGMGASVLGTAEAEAAVVNLNLGPGGFNILGVNGNINPYSTKSILNFPFSGSQFQIDDSPGPGAIVLGAWGAPNKFYFATDPNASYAAPINFGVGATIGASSGAWEWGIMKPTFQYGTFVSPDFGPGSYLGFKAVSGGDSYYGYLESTWTATSKEFQFLSAAYESTPNTPITITSVPEPSTVALTGIGALALGAGAIRRSRKARRESLAQAV